MTAPVQPRVEIPSYPNSAQAYTPTLPWTLGRGIPQVDTRAEKRSRKKLALLISSRLGATGKEAVDGQVDSLCPTSMHNLTQPYWADGNGSRIKEIFLPPPYYQFYLLSYNCCNRYYKVCDFKIEINVLSHSKKSKIKVSRKLVPSGGSERESDSHLSPGF
jgi:hypothetical protein